MSSPSLVVSCLILAGCGRDSERRSNVDCSSPKTKHSRVAQNRERCELSDGMLAR